MPQMQFSDFHDLQSPSVRNPHRKTLEVNIRCACMFFACNLVTTPKSQSKGGCLDFDTSAGLLPTSRALAPPAPAPPQLLPQRQMQPPPQYTTFSPCLSTCSDVYRKKKRKKRGWCIQNTKIHRKNTQTRIHHPPPVHHLRTQKKNRKKYPKHVFWEGERGGGWWWGGRGEGGMTWFGHFTTHA